MISPLLHDDPHTVGPFRLLARLGGGGMGTVYLARSAGGRTVAVKTLHTRLAADTTLRTRFRLEADAARVIGSEHGAAVVDADPQAPTPWMATEYVLGPPLDTAVEAGGPLPEPTVRALGAALAAGLEQLHRSEVVHRDLKPSNVLVTAHGPRIIDFGIARAFGDAHLTDLGSAVGTPAFMSPEQAAGREHAAAGDVFALAGVLVFAATGRGPFGGGAPTDLLYRVRYGEPELGGVPPSLLPLLTRCLAKDPADRPSTAELRAALGGAAGAPADRDGFAELLPDAVLREIARRSDAVWRELPHRTAPPAPTEAPQTAPTGTGISRRQLLYVAGGALLGGGALGGGGWALFGRSGGGGTGTTKNDAVDKPKPPAPLWSAALWCPETGGEVMTVGRNLAMRAGIVLNGFNAESGASTWQANIADPWRSATDGTRIYGLRDHEDKAASLAVCEVSQTDGQLGKPLVDLAAFAGKEQYNQLVRVADGVAYLVARAASGKRWYLVAADLDSGKERWRSPVEGPQLTGRPPALCGAVTGSRVVLCGSPSDGSHFIDLSAYDRKSGRRLWLNAETFDGTPPTRMVVDDQHVYLSGGYLTARRLSDGELAWLFGNGRNGSKAGGADGTRRYGAATLHDGVVYCTEGDQGLIAVDAASGTLNWQEKGLSGRKSKPDVAPAIGKRFAYCADDKGLRAIDLRARQAVWTYETAPLVLTADPKGGRLYVRQEKRTLALPLT
ncbi:protein kinase [Streptomyces sp. NPDC056411]|uniref:protein kinase domain-containing protein n=1 Tax=Streptomyces sp. NPDC056411 TaxID=3345813 RepID=UPI0035D960C0